MSTTTSQHYPGDVQQQRVASVVADMSMSLDGFIADTDDGVDRVFAWYTKPQPPRQAAGEADRDSSGLGVIVYGRRTFEVANGWGGNHPLGVPVIVLTHSIPDGWPRLDSSVLFNTDGIESAIAQAKTLADGKDVALGSPTITQQCLDLKLIDRLQVSLVPLLLGNGIRFFESLKSAPIELETPTVSEGNGVTHLAYRVP
jgi:dihydrofolate reductase